MYIVIVCGKSIELLVLIGSDIPSASPFSSPLHLLQIVISEGIIIIITLRKLTKNTMTISCLRIITHV